MEKGVQGWGKGRCWIRHIPISICIFSIGISTLLEKKLECVYGIQTASKMGMEWYSHAGLTLPLALAISQVALSVLSTIDGLLHFLT